MTSKKLSISLPNDLLERADRVLARAGEGRSALVARVVAQAIRDAEEAEIDRAYERAYAEYSLGQRELERSDALARAAVRSTRNIGRKRGTPV